ncbi:Zn(2)-C6 fungal-type domain-containing protein [Madurella fahalii]|uniref:Zn(2)-C6 fungal-type domain-containing protein n=1 Tax=Madurella fahalii TaxID=1157608 RepID=A0ABQ0GAR4_9PEZI
MWVPSVASPAGLQGAYYQPPAAPTYFSPALFPSPPQALMGSELPSVGHSLDPESCSLYMTGGRSMYAAGPSGDQVTCQFPMHDAKESPPQAVLGHLAAGIVSDISTAAVSPVSPLPHDNMGALDQHRLVELTLPYAGVVKQPRDEERVKNEYSDQSDCDEREAVPAEVDLSGQYVDVAQELANSGSDGEETRDRKKRGRFDEGLRKQTSNTRSIGACLRCHNQRVRCVPNKFDSSPLAPCETCLNVHRDSKKTIHYIPCLRFKVTLVLIYRPGYLELTRRFDHTKVMDVADYPDDRVYDILIDQGLCANPVRLRVRRFVPREGDVLCRRYVDNGVPKEQYIPPFCLADSEKTARQFKEYIYRNALAGLAEAVKTSDDIVKDIFAMIAKHCSSLPDPVKAEGAESRKEAKKNPDQKEFLEKTVTLWFATRHGTGSAWLCGEELLGMSPHSEPNAPLPGRVSVPRMIVAQFDSIRHERIYKKLAPWVFRTLETFLTSCNKEAWFTVFLATFLLLHQTACTCADRYRYTQQNAKKGGADTRYGDLNHPLTHFVEEVQHGAVMLLAHWQYFKRCDLMNFNWDDVADSALMFLEPYQLQFVKNIVSRVKRKFDSIPKIPAEGCWEHELFWISQMFVSQPSRTADWTPPETFSQAKPSVGREAVLSSDKKRN